MEGIAEVYYPSPTLPNRGYSVARSRKDYKPPARDRAEFSVTQEYFDSKGLLAAIVDSSDDAIIAKDLSGIVTAWNKGAERMYGYKQEEILGKPLSIIAPSDRVDEIPAIIERIQKGERVEHFESVRVAKNGHQLKVSITVSPIKDEKGNIVGASAIARDITAMVRAREALQESQSTAQALFQSAAQGIFIVDRTGRIIMANPATEKMFGYSSNELIGQPIEVLIPQHLHSIHTGHRDRYFAQPQSRPMGLGLDLQARRKDGGEFYAEISLSHIQSAQGTLAVAFVTDISKRRADEMALREQKQILRDLAGRLMTAQDDERRRIARNLHDDLSQQLAHLAIDLGKMATKPSLKDAVTDLRPLQLRAGEAAETVRRISHDLHPSILDDIGLEAAIEQYCDEFEKRTGIATEFASRDVPDAIRPEVANSVYHIAQEALRNVAKHSKTDSVLVRLESSDRNVRLTVKDNGVGLGASESEGRKGIGLSAMRERAYLINATLSIQSEPGEGTEVAVEVPIA
jgi:PAS domain S-box-containing protein